MAILRVRNKPQIGHRAPFPCTEPLTKVSIQEENTFGYINFNSSILHCGPSTVLSALPAWLPSFRGWSSWSIQKELRPPRLAAHDKYTRNQGSNSGFPPNLTGFVKGLDPATYILYVCIRTLSIPPFLWLVLTLPQKLLHKIELEINVITWKTC